MALNTEISKRVNKMNDDEITNELNEIVKLARSSVGNFLADRSKRDQTINRLQALYDQITPEQRLLIMAHKKFSDQYHELHEIFDKDTNYYSWGDPIVKWFRDTPQVSLDLCLEIAKTSEDGVCQLLENSSQISEKFKEDFIYWFRGMTRALENKFYRLASVIVQQDKKTLKQALERIIQLVYSVENAILTYEDIPLLLESIYEIYSAVKSESELGTASKIKYQLLNLVYDKLSVDDRCQFLKKRADYAVVNVLTNSSDSTFFWSGKGYYCD